MTELTNDTELFELCNEVYKRFPEWDGGKRFAYDLTFADKWLRYVGDFPHDTREWKLESMVPLYDSDYLLEKLESSVVMPNPDVQDEPHIAVEHSGVVERRIRWGAKAYVEGWFEEVSDSPLKALLKFVLALDDGCLCAGAGN